MDTLSQRLSMEICIIIILLVTVKKVKASSYSCDETKKTVEIVDDCPDSAEKWKKAAARKNCSAHAHQCNDPERFLYHCVINAYANQTLEVCAYAQNIVAGYCTEYNVLGNLIQSSLRTSCREFNIKPCPIFYISNEAYKCPSFTSLNISSIISISLAFVVPFQLMLQSCGRVGDKELRDKDHVRQDFDLVESFLFFQEMS